MEKLDNIDNLSYIIYERFQCSLREIYQIMEVRIAIPAITVFVSCTFYKTNICWN